MPDYHPIYDVSPDEVAARVSDPNLVGLEYFQLEGSDVRRYSRGPSFGYLVHDPDEGTAWISDAEERSARQGDLTPATAPLLTLELSRAYHALDRYAELLTASRTDLNVLQVRLRNAGLDDSLPSAPLASPEELAELGRDVDFSNLDTPTDENVDHTAQVHPTGEQPTPADERSVIEDLEAPMPTRQAEANPGLGLPYGLAPIRFTPNHEATALHLSGSDSIHRIIFDAAQQELRVMSGEKVALRVDAAGAVDIPLPVNAAHALVESFQKVFKSAFEDIVDRAIYERVAEKRLTVNNPSEARALAERFRQKS